MKQSLSAIIGSLSTFGIFQFKEFSKDLTELGFETLIMYSGYVLLFIFSLFVILGIFYILTFYMIKKDTESNFSLIFYKNIILVALVFCIFIGLFTNSWVFWFSLISISFLIFSKDLLGIKDYIFKIRKRENK